MSTRAMVTVTAGGAVRVAQYVCANGDPVDAGVDLLAILADRGLIEELRAAAPRVNMRPWSDRVGIARGITNSAADALRRAAESGAEFFDARDMEWWWRDWTYAIDLDASTFAVARWDRPVASWPLDALPSEEDMFDAVRHAREWSGPR